MVMTELIEPGLKPDPPRGGYFCALLFSLPSTIFCIFITEGGRNEPFYSSDVIRMGQGFFQITGHFVLTCFRFKDVFKKKIIPFEAVNKK